jgi:hypothetical protein
MSFVSSMLQDSNLIARKSADRNGGGMCCVGLVTPFSLMSTIPLVCCYYPSVPGRLQSDVPNRQIVQYTLHPLPTSGLHIVYADIVRQLSKANYWYSNWK